VKIFVLGGGPAGLALVDGLNDTSTEFILFERSPTLGGLAQTVKWGEHGSHDLGPHKIFTLNKDLMNRVMSLIPKQDWLTRPKHSKIFMKGHYLPYPPSPFSLINVFGPFKFALMVLDYAWARAKCLLGTSDDKTFEDDVVHRVGGGLYKALFKPIAVKLWGDPKDLDVKLSKGRVQTPSLKEILSKILKVQKKSEFEALEFLYPKGGLQRLWNSISNKASKSGQFLLNTEITTIKVEDGYVKEIVALDRISGISKSFSVSPDDMIFSSLPLGSLVKLMDQNLSQSTKQTIKEVVNLNDLILVFLKINKPELIKESWVFIPDPDIAFHRLSEQKAFDPSMTADGSIVCCEIMSSKIRPMGEKTDKELIELSLKGISDMKISDFSVIDSKVIRLPKSYPVFRPNFEPGLRSVLQELDLIKNFKTIGRQGAFNYIGTLDAMDIGYGAAQWCQRHNEEKESALWQQERARTSFYPVLD